MLKITLNHYLLVFWPWLKLKSNSTSLMDLNVVFHITGPPNDNFHLSSQGRIWIAWNPDIWICNVYVVSIQHITLQVKNKGGLEGYITIVYGLNTIGERIKLWRTLE